MESNIFERVTNSNHGHIKKYTAPQEKNKAFRQEIRKNDIQQRRRKMRESLMEASNEDYVILKQINLNRDLADLSQLKYTSWKEVEGNQELERIINNMFKYSNSQESDHMYILFEDSTIIILSEMVESMQHPFFQQFPQAYRKIWWILQNYTDYNNYGVPLAFVRVLEKIWSNSSKPHNNSISKNKQISILQHVISSLSNLSRENIFLSQYMVSFDDSKQGSDLNSGFLQQIINKASEIGKACRNCYLLVDEYEGILKRIYSIFSNILGKLHFFDSPYVSHMVNILIEHFIIFQGYRQIHQNILEAINDFLLENIQTHPEILLNYDISEIVKSFAKQMESFIALNFKIVNYNNFCQAQGDPKLQPLGELTKQSKNVEKLVLKHLSILKIIYGFNIPSDNNEQRYQNLLNNLLQDYLLPQFFQIFKLHSNKIDIIKQTCCSVLEDICLVEVFCEQVIGDFTIMSKIFCYANIQSSFRLKKSALRCIANITLISLDGDSSIKQQVLQLLINNHFLKMLAANIAQYTDEQLNQALINSLGLLLEELRTEKGQFNLHWKIFAEEGGIVKLEKYIKNSRSKQLTSKAQNILDFYREQ